MGGLDRRALPHAAACASPARYAKEPPLPADSRWIVARCLPNRCATAAALNPAADIASILTRSSKHKRRAILKTSTGRLLTELTGHHGRSVATTGRVRRGSNPQTPADNGTLQQPPPTPWAIPCADEVVTVEAVVRFGDSLTSGQTYNVIANGVETATFTAP